MSSSINRNPFKITGFETNYRRYVKPPTDTRCFSPVIITPDDRAADIKKLRDMEHKRSEQKKTFTEETHYAARLLAQARSYNIRDLPQIPLRTLDEFIRNSEELIKFNINLEKLIDDYVNAKETKKMNKTEEVTDENMKRAQTLLRKAKFYRIKDIPEKVPRDGDLKKFIKDLNKTIQKHKEEKEAEVYQLLIDMKATKKADSNVLKFNCMKIALPLIAITGASLLMLRGSSIT
ncbi:MAG: hypothetical protein KR126chlam5_00299 [Candidatus Anoxychlamydiales bacterium]|nr:hypothetical protein [Candidatus Anoxychlamydiales bacterium]